MLLEAAGCAGSLYLTRSYLRDKFDEVKEKMEIERIASDNLLKRFSQTQEDVSYTVLTLLPTLSEQILQTMDIEPLTRELQSRSRTSSNKLSTVSNLIPRDRQNEGDGYSSLSSSVDLVDSNLSAPFDSSGNVSETRTTPRSPTPSASATSSLAESSEDNDHSEGRRIRVAASMDQAHSATGTLTEEGEKRGKAELWNEVKMMTFTRTLTTLYSISLLCLFTNLQLTLLARSKYVSSILEQEKEERVREQLEAGLTASNLVFGSLGLGPAAGTRLESLLSGGPLDDDQPGVQGDIWRTDGIGEDTESKYLTLSWWLLHVGWKDVSERVRRAVEETFDGVSLKTRIATKDLHLLIRDVRRRVEHEITFEGKEKRANFLSSLLPPTTETVYHVLTQGGYKPTLYPHQSSYATESTELFNSLKPSQDFIKSPADLPQSTLVSGTPAAHIRLLDEPFASLLSETRSILSSPDFAQVFEVCVDHATNTLLDSLENKLFGPHSGQNAGTEEETRIKLAALLPSLAKWSQLTLNGLPNELIDKTLNYREVTCFSAILFSRFEDRHS